MRCLPCLDDEDRAHEARLSIDIPHERSFTLAQETLGIVATGSYQTPSRGNVSIADAVARARGATVSLAPDAVLPVVSPAGFAEMCVQVTNETTTSAARRLVAHHRTVALNFANGLVPGGGFVGGARAQEESLCRASALYELIRHDAMYEIHASRGDAGSSDHAILSPDVPFFRDDAWDLLDEPYLLSVLTCAAPVAYSVGHRRAAELLRRRIHRVLAIMASYRYEAIVLGAWGCGAFGNDPRSTAADFHDALMGPFRGRFREVVFAVADWSLERRTLGPFRDAFGR